MFQQTITLPNCLITFTTNAGSARSSGLEFEIAGDVQPGLQVRGGAGFDHAVITSEGLSQQPVGSRIYEIPRWTVSVSGTYAGPLGFGMLDFSHVGDSVSGTTGVRAPLVRPVYNILNARFGVRWERSEFAIFADNITNEKGNLGDLNPISYAPNDASGNRRPRIVLITPLRVGVQYRRTF